MKQMEWKLSWSVACTKSILFTGILLTLTLPYSSAGKVISTYTGKVGPGNYSYFSLHEKGSITIMVESITGDADIYVSENYAQPSFSEYDMQSSTCGIDTVMVPKSFKRPVHIAIYGHVHSLLTEYKITAILDHGTGYQSGQESFNENNAGVKGADEDDETPSLQSIIWSIVVGILKIILEVMF